MPLTSTEKLKLHLTDGLNPNLLPSQGVYRPKCLLNWSLFFGDANASHASFIAESDPFFHPWVKFCLGIFITDYSPHRHFNYWHQTHFDNMWWVTEMRVNPSSQDSITIEATYGLRASSVQTHTQTHIHTPTCIHSQHLIRGVRCCDLNPNLSSAVRIRASAWIGWIRAGKWKVPHSKKYGNGKGLGRGIVMGVWKIRRQNWGSRVMSYNAYHTFYFKLHFQNIMKLQVLHVGYQKHALSFL